MGEVYLQVKYGMHFLVVCIQNQHALSECAPTIGVIGNFK